LTPLIKILRDPWWRYEIRTVLYLFLIFSPHRLCIFAAIKAPKLLRFRWRCAPDVKQVCVQLLRTLRTWHCPEMDAAEPIPDTTHFPNNPTRTDPTFSEQTRPDQTQPKQAVNRYSATLLNCFMSVISRSREGTRCRLILSHTELTILSKVLQTLDVYTEWVKKAGPQTRQ